MTAPRPRIARQAMPGSIALTLASGHIFFAEDFVGTVAENRDLLQRAWADPAIQAEAREHARRIGRRPWAETHL